MAIVVTDLASAVDAFRAFAVDSFKAALVEAQLSKPTDPTNDEKALAKNVANWEAATSKAKTQMASALQQLAHADVMLSELKGRDSYKTLVGLVLKANTAVEGLIDNPGGLTVQEQAQLITAHAALLESLAEIVPLALWQKGQTDTATG